MAAKKSTSEGTAEEKVTKPAPKKEKTMNIRGYLEQHGDMVPKYHRESFKILFKGMSFTKTEWDERVRKELKRTVV